MNLLVVGLLAILIGLVACFAGYRLFQLLLPVFGFFVGFGIGAQAAERFLGNSYLGSPLDWVIAVIAGVVVALIAFAWWYIAVALAFAGLGYALGFGIAGAVGIGDGAAATVVALIVAVLFAIAAVVLRLPAALVIVATAGWGASLLISGVLLLVGRLDLAAVRNGSVDAVVRDSPLLLVIWIVLFISGAVIQYMTTRDFILQRPVRTV